MQERRQLTSVKRARRGDNSMRMNEIARSSFGAGLYAEELVRIPSLIKYQRRPNEQCNNAGNRRAAAELDDEIRIC